MLRFVITVAAAAACIAGADLAHAGAGAGALPAAQSTLDYPNDAYAYAQKSKKVYVYERISKGPRGQAAPSALVVESQPIRTFPKDELYGVACVTPFQSPFTCPGGGM